MRPIDADDGPVAALAADLRELRAEAGNPPFRQMAKRAHYSATTLSVACSGTALPSLEVTLAFVRACGGPEGLWRDRWTEVASSHAVVPGFAVDDGAPGPDKAPPERRRLNRGLAMAGLSVGSAALALVVAAVVGFGSSAASPGYIGVTRCDPGSYPVMHQVLRLPERIRLGGDSFPAGTVVGTVVLMYSPACSEGWPHFSPAGAFFNRQGLLTLTSRSTPDNAVNVSPQYHVITFVDGEPMLTVLGCVDAQASVTLADGLTVKGSTPCFQRA